MERLIDIDGDVRREEDYVFPQGILREYRAAWRWPTEGNEVEIDVDAARDIHMSVIRRQRDQYWPMLDVAFLRALELDDAHIKERIIRVKNALREAPDHALIRNAATIDDLVAASLAALANPVPFYISSPQTTTPGPAGITYAVRISGAGEELTYAVDNGFEIGNLGVVSTPTGLDIESITGFTVSVTDPSRPEDDQTITKYVEIHHE